MYEDQTVDHYVEVDEDEEEEEDESSKFDDVTEKTAASSLLRRTLDVKRAEQEEDLCKLVAGSFEAIVYCVRTKPLAWKEAYELLTNADLLTITPVKPYRPAGGNVYLYDPSAHNFTKSAWRADGYTWDTTYGGANLYPSKIEKSESLIKKLLWPLHKADKRFVRYEWLLTDKSLKSLKMKSSYVLVHYVGDESVFIPTGRRTRNRNPINPYLALSRPVALTNNVSPNLHNPFSSKVTGPKRKMLVDNPDTNSNNSNGTQVYEHTYYVHSQASKPSQPQMEPDICVSSSQAEESNLRIRLLAQEFELKKQLMKKKMDAADAKKKYYEMLTNQNIVHQF